MSGTRRAEPASGLGGLWEAVFARRRRIAPDEMRDKVWTLATCLTLIRVVLSVAVLLFAIIEGRQALLVAGLVFGMSLDTLDGYVARRRKAETILGAQLDGLADRLVAALVLAGAVSVNPSTENAVAAAVVWTQYGIVEQFLNAQFLRFGLWSPDHFYLENELVWRLNWSALAKMASGAPLALMALGLWWAALATALVLIALRVPCYRWIADSAKSLSEARPRSREVGAELTLDVESPPAEAWPRPAFREVLSVLSPVDEVPDGAAGQPPGSVALERSRAQPDIAA